MLQSTKTKLFRPFPAAWPERLRSRLACRPAFSLIELMIVLAILSVIAALVVPNLQRSFARNDIREAATQLQEQIGELQIESSQTGSPILLQFGWESQQLKVRRLKTLPINSADGSSSPALSTSSLDSLLPNTVDSDADKWTENIITLSTDAWFSETTADLDSSNNVSRNSLPSTSDDIASTNDSLPASDDSIDALGPAQWSQPLVITGYRFQRDQIIWLSSPQWNCPLLFSAISGQVTLGPIRSSAPPTAPSTDSQTDSSSETLP